MAGNLTVADTVAGGEGTDTLSLTVANGAFVSVANAANVSGIETLSLASGSCYCCSYYGYGRYIWSHQ